ncbi:matrix extracellular phosphoglycoprotein isoform X2 [Hippopotamus amphibius kiboko]|uniref:matrix extracellular phosphoglycoprotein isoform X2 n=1 Tax=Hippopotamus amphibius kiboko TaxID=575201 RepID=UPI002598C8D6|nr:matrix extracellular phosphoglycoprotein isoform X2 [Hippopotamus amphibius kiboko]
MQIICLGLLLFSLTLAAPTLQPQAEKTKQDCVEEQRITYKGHHEKHGYYIFKYVYTSSGRKNQSDVKEEKNKDNVALPHSGKRRNQEPAPKENIVQRKEKGLSLHGTNEKNKSTKSQNLLEKRQMMNKDYSVNNKENAHNGLKMPFDPESAGNHGAEVGDNAISKLDDQEEYGEALIRNNLHHRMEPGTVMELLGKENKENKPRNVLSKIPAGANYAKAPSKIKKNHQRDSQAQNNPVKSKSTHHLQHNVDYQKQLPKVKKVLSDFEGSGYPDLQGRGDTDISPFSGDGPPFKDISGKGDAIGPDREGTDSQIEFSSPSEVEIISPDTRGPGYNEIPDHGGHTIGTRGETAQEANAADVRLVDGSNDITGSTDFKKLPGKEGNRVDGSSQNAHQGKTEFHYPHTPTEDKRKDGSSDGAESTNEIPKSGKGGSRKGTEHSNRNQATSKEKQRFPSKGKGQGQLIPSRRLDNEIKNEVGSHNGPNNEGTIITHSRKNYYVPHRQNNSARNKGVSQSKGSWGYRKPHSNRRFRPPKKHDSSDSSDSGSSSESDGD